MFVVGNIVKKKDGIQKYKIVEVLENNEYNVILYPFLNNDLILTFKEDSLELVF